MTEIECLVKELLEAKEAYYNTDDPILSDDEFDEKEDRLKSIDPGNSYFTIIGTDYMLANKKITHNVPMRSLDKDKEAAGVYEWLEKINCEKELLIEMPKIDGLSGAVIYEKGKLRYITTRGNGYIGEDITHIAPYLNIPKSILIKDRSIEIRGEIYLPKNVTIDNPENKSLRNIAVGLVRRQSGDLDERKHLRFVAYFVIGADSTSLLDSLNLAARLKFNVVDFTRIIPVAGSIENQYKDYLSHRRNDWPMQTDGLVYMIDDMTKYNEINSKYVVNKHNFWGFALKPPAEEKETTLREIEGSVSKSGAVIPVAIFDAVTLGNARVTRATLNNYKNVADLDLHIGDIILISKNGDIIPFFKKVVQKCKEGKTQIPTRCPSCNTILIKQGVHLVCSNRDCPEMNIQLISSWIKKCKMKNVSEETVRKLYTEGIINKVKDLYTLYEHHAELLTINGFGEIKMDNLLTEIEKSRNLSIIQFLDRLNIPSIGERAAEKLGIKAMNDFIAFDDTTTAAGKKVIQFRDSNIGMIKELEKELCISDILLESRNTLGKVCMTGSGPRGRQQLVKELKDLGYISVDTVTKGTDFLICDDTDGNSSKLKAAKKLGIHIVTYKEFFDKGGTNES